MRERRERPKAKVNGRFTDSLIMTWAVTRPVKGFVLLGAWFALAATAYAAEIDSSGATAAFARLEQIRASAAQGHADAQFKLGDFYYARGDFTNAASWYELAADQEHRGAQLSLATCYLMGRGVMKDVDLAAFWAERAREALNQPKTTWSPPAGSLEIPGAMERLRPALRSSVTKLDQVVPEVEVVHLRFLRYDETDAGVNP